jgi:hypothetical protein
MVNVILLSVVAPSMLTPKVNTCGWCYHQINTLRMRETAELFEDATKNICWSLVPLIKIYFGANWYDVVASLCLLIDNQHGGSI